MYRAFIFSSNRFLSLTSFSTLCTILNVYLNVLIVIIEVKIQKYTMRC